ncbi:MAG TPA: hypothetical protein VMF08_22830 [Candidatus Sulfotelmatobacter sp.]|nr:hypothetical protein [Candidatus Sulfotelmatobacter sp.]
MKTVFLKLAECIFALLAGWIAAAVPMAVSAHLPAHADIRDVAWLFFLLVTGALVVPCWILIAVPLFVFLRSRAVFWRYYVSIPFGAVIGLLISFALAFALYAGPVSGAGTGIFWLTLSGAASGAMTFGVMSWMNGREHKNEEKMARPGLTVEPAK